MKNSEKITFSLHDDMNNDEAQAFLISIMDHYHGTIQYKIYRTKEFLDDLIFHTKYDLENPFSNNSRKYYDLAVFTRSILIPQLLEALEKHDNSEPFDVHGWN